MMDSGMTRRAMIGATLATAPGAVLAGVVDDRTDARPSLHLQQVSDHRWRFRSWRLRGGAWRPIVGTIAVDGGTPAFSVMPDARDLPAIHAALGEMSRVRSGSKAR